MKLARERPNSIDLQLASMALTKTQEREWRALRSAATGPARSPKCSTGPGTWEDAVSHVLAQRVETHMPPRLWHPGHKTTSALCRPKPLSCSGTRPPRRTCDGTVQGTGYLRSLRCTALPVSLEDGRPCSIVRVHDRRLLP